MSELTYGDLNFVLSRCPRDVVALLRTGRVYLGGGFIRETVAGNKPNDVDLFGMGKDELKETALNFALKREGRIHSTDNAVTVLCPPRLPVQFITRWTFSEAAQCSDSFDFTVCQAVVWFDGEHFKSSVHENFYSDLAARRLVYTFPMREEEAGGSMLRVRKFLQRGYSIQAQSLAGVISRLVGKVDFHKASDERSVAKVITALLHEVDPLTVIDGVEMVDEHEVLEQEQTP